MTFSNPGLLRISLVALALGISGPTSAAIFLTQNCTGTLGAGNTFGGAPLADNTVISYSVTFDTASITNVTGIELFSAIDFSLTIAGHGTYSVNPAAWSVILSDPTSPSYSGVYLSGLVKNFGGETDTGGFFAGFQSATPAFTTATPEPTVFAGYLGMMSGTFVIDLPGVTGGLGVNQFTSVSSMSITAVPEPVETASAVGLGLGAYVFLRRKSKTAAR